MKYFICPICKSAVTFQQTALVCEHRHQFDRAKEGYFNLLPVQYKKSKAPGDSKEQLRARRSFLRAGYFSVLIEKLRTLIPVQSETLLDIGCGEGYFTEQLAEHLLEKSTAAEVYGVDIAKEGVRLAAKGSAAFYAVASSNALPIASQSMDVVTRIYAPSQLEELQRVLKPHGLLLVVTPGPDHLIGIRQQIYQTVRAHPAPELFPGFSLLATHLVTDDLVINNSEHLDALLKMTPFAWKINAELQTALSQLPFVVRVDFQISLYQLQ